MKRKQIVAFEDPLAVVGDKQQFAFEDMLAQRREPEEIVVPQRGNVCRFYAKGYCIRGTTCPHKHWKNERAVVCKHWLRGLCKKDELCEFLHEYDMAKMPECFFFTQYGECSNEDCLYLHITNKERESVCQFYKRGFCRHGAACRNRHEERVLCPNYVLGFCPNGPNCDYGHPMFDYHEDRNVECHNCGKLGHRAAECKEPRRFGGGFGGGAGGGGGRPFTCYNCGKPGHAARDCSEVRVDRARDPRF